MTNEFERVCRSGWVALVVLLLATIGTGWGLVDRIAHAVQFGHLEPKWSLTWPIIAWALGIAVMTILWVGLFTLQPNEAAVLLLFGEYKGTARRSGFHYANPFYSRIKISLRARTLNGEKLKVNDQRGNPIEIAAVVVWRVEDTAKATFDVESYQTYVEMQSETAVRHLASAYPYDSTDDKTISLRGSMDEVSAALRVELQERLAKAGVIVEEARLSHLAYAPEIAGAMLRRQQAEAVVAARTRIVEGAIGMVQTALEHLDRDRIVELDTERKAAMVSNLLVVLCGEQAAQPVVNTGSLYT
ncbi:MAG: SPFH domain-containing protein [Phycisphaerae bacterium]|nr:SPFH domain-containing protein [Phycisphaerae bacterium]